MTSVQDRAISVSLVLVESIWLYALFSTLGILLGLSGSPVTWIGCLCLYGVGLYFSRMISWLKLKNIIASLLMMIVGFPLMYVVLGNNFATNETWFSLIWLIEVYNTELEDQVSLFHVVMAFVCALLIWVRSVRSGSDDLPLTVLISAFRIGILILVIAVTVDAFYAERLHMTSLMFLFFFAALSGMSFGHIMPSTRGVRTYRWIPMIMGIVAIVLSFGAVFSALKPSVIAKLSQPIIYMFFVLVQLLIYLIVVPVAFLVHATLKVLLWIIGERDPNTAFAQLVEASGQRLSLQGLEAETVRESEFMFTQFLEITALFIGIALIFVVLFWTFRRRIKWGRLAHEKDKVDISEGANPFSDLFRLSKNLLLGKKSTNLNPVFSIPDDLDEASKEILASYYAMRKLAEEKGTSLENTLTPHESVSKLDKVFSVETVTYVTEKFVYVCYGDVKFGVEESSNVKDKVNNLKNRSNQKVFFPTQIPK